MTEFVFILFCVLVFLFVVYLIFFVINFFVDLKKAERQYAKQKEIEHDNIVEYVKKYYEINYD